MLRDPGSRWRDWGPFALVAVLPTLAVVLLGWRAVRNEEAAVRREMQAQLEQAATHAQARWDEAVGTLGSLPAPSVEEARAPASMPFAEPVVIDGDGHLLVPAVPDGDADASRATAPAECAELASELSRQPAGASRLSVAEKFLAACELAQGPTGRRLWPVVALDPEVGAKVPGERLEAWLVANGAALSDAEREATRRELRAASWLEPTRRERLVALLSAARGATRELQAVLRDKALRLRVVPGQERAVSWRDERALAELRPSGSGRLGGFVVHHGSIARAWHAGWPELPTGIASRLSERRDRPPGPCVELLPGGLYLELGWGAGATVASRTRQSLALLLATACFAALAAIAFAALLFGRIRAERRLSALRTDFVAAVSHELRTPIASLRMLSELLEQGAVEPEEQAEVYGALAREARRLGHTVDRLLTFSRMEAKRAPLATEELSVVELANRAIDTFLERHPTARVTRPATEPAPFAAVDATQLIMALDNLLSNAAKHAPGGEPYRVSVEVVGDEVRLAVADHGPGIARQDLERIFRPFERADDRLSQATEGSGIGLSLVRHVARAHGGRAWAESELGAGATFVIALPRRGRQQPSGDPST